MNMHRLYCNGVCSLLLIVGSTAFAQSSPDLSDRKCIASPSWLPDWSDVGYLGGESLPDGRECLGEA